MTKQTKSIAAVILGTAAIGLTTYLLSGSSDKIYPTKQGDGGLFITDQSYKGKTIVLQASQGEYTYVYVGVDSVTIVNEGEVHLSKGFDIAAKNITIVGNLGRKSFTVNQHQYSGNVSAAISIHGEAENIKISGITADSVGFFAWIKNEPDCGLSTNTWVLKNIEISDFDVRHCMIEGVYAGSTNVLKDSTTNVRPIYCNGVLTPIPPPRLGKIEIHHGSFDGTGRGSVQISFASEDTALVHDLTIKNVGREYNEFQGNGINLGSFTKAKVWNNTISNTLCAGICSFGSYLEAWNNTIDSSGYLDGRHTTWPASLWVDTRKTVGFEKTRMNIHDNKVGLHGTDGDMAIFDQVGNGYYGDNVITRNVSTVTGKPVVLNVAPSIIYSSDVPTPPQPSDVYVFKKGYGTDPKTLKRVYFIMYSDGRWIKTNSKYQPL